MCAGVSLRVIEGFILYLSQAQPAEGAVVWERWIKNLAGDSEGIGVEVARSSRSGTVPRERKWG
jgi:hypothetical protein